MSEDASNCLQEQTHADAVHLLWNRRVLMLHGLSSELVHRLASINTVLPFIFISIGAPTFFAGLIVPILTATQAIGKAVFAPIIAGASLHKFYLAAGTSITMLGLATIAFSSTNSPVLELTIIFLTVVTIIGLGRGMSTLAYHTMLPTLLKKKQPQPIDDFPTGSRRRVDDIYRTVCTVHF